MSFVTFALVLAYALPFEVLFSIYFIIIIKLLHSKVQHWHVQYASAKNTRRDFKLREVWVGLLIRGEASHLWYSSNLRVAMTV